MIELCPMFRSNIILVLLENLLNDCSIISKNCRLATHVLISYDWYFNNSLKNLTRNGRVHGPKLLFNEDTPLPSKSNDSFVKNNDNKERMNSYCADKFQSYQEDTHPFSVTKGKCVLSSSTLDELISTITAAEEADQKLVCHMIQRVRSGVKQCVVRTVDTDVVISLTAYRRLAENWDCVLFTCLSSTVSRRFYKINKIAEEHGERKYRALPFFYALTGFPHSLIRVSSNFGIGGQNHRKKRL